jgi:formamidopyrimidine-DNA glycosylase
VYDSPVPELPDLVYIEETLRGVLPGRRIRDVRVYDPVVLRVAVPGGFVDSLRGRSFGELRRHGPFLHLALPPLALVVHFMLAGRFVLRPGLATGRRRGKDHCFSLDLPGHELEGPDREGPLELAYLDDRRMGKVYLVEEGGTALIPGFSAQGVDVLSEEFTLERLQESIRGHRRQVRVLLMDQTALSAVGNAYADEILFAARIHPKTGCNQLGQEEIRRLYDAIRGVLSDGIAAVRAAGRPIEEKVRGHLKVRNRHGEPCPICGTKIRRAGVLGYDAYFCPRCQPAAGPGFIPWGRASEGGEGDSELPPPRR